VRGAESLRTLPKLPGILEPWPHSLRPGDARGLPARSFGGIGRSDNRVSRRHGISRSFPHRFGMVCPADQSVPRDCSITKGLCTAVPLRGRAGGHGERQRRTTPLRVSSGGPRAPCRRKSRAGRKASAVCCGDRPREVRLQRKRDSRRSACVTRQAADSPGDARQVSFRADRLVLRARRPQRRSDRREKVFNSLDRSLRW